MHACRQAGQRAAADANLNFERGFLLEAEAGGASSSLSTLVSTSVGGPSSSAVTRLFRLWMSLAWSALPVRNADMTFFRSAADSACFPMHVTTDCGGRTYTAPFRRSSRDAGSRVRAHFPWAGRARAQTAKLLRTCFSITASCSGVSPSLFLT